MRVLSLLGQGKTSKEIATLLRISVTTVASYRRALCLKLGLHSTAELVHWATIQCINTPFAGFSPLQRGLNQDGQGHIIVPWTNEEVQKQ